MQVNTRVKRAPWWLTVTVIWVLSRVVTTLFLLSFAARQQENAWTGAHPDYFSFASLWDGTWYHIIATSGYPTELPTTPDGRVGENAWAFMPGYPMLVRGLMMLFGSGWEVTSVVVSVVFSWAGALLFYQLMRTRLPPGTSIFAVVLLCVAPLSPIMQVAYAESMHAFFLTLALYLVVTRNYRWLFPIIAIMAITRPTGLAFALALGLHVVHRWVRRGQDPFSRSERWLTVGSAVFSGAMGLVWPALAWMVTGSITAYTDTELAWRAPYIGHGELTPFTPWVQGANFWFPAPWGPIILAGVAAGFVVFLTLPSTRKLGFDLIAWAVSYALYLAAVFFPQSSTFRLLLPLFPLVGALAQPRSRWYRAALVGVSLLGQWVWIDWCWWVDDHDWTPP